MMEGWKEVKLEEIADVVGGGTPSTKEDSYWNGDVNWVTPADLSGYMFKHISAGERKITKLGLSKSSAKLHPKGTVLMTSRAPIGYLAIAGDEVATNQGFQSLRCKTDKVDHNFLYYILHLYKEGIQAIASGATFPEVSGKKVKGFKIKIPPLPTQRKIASILSAYDELIENNLKRIKIMEEKAQLTYEEWFVRMKFPGHETTPINKEPGLPMGWEKMPLGEFTNVLKGKNITKSTVREGNVPVVAGGLSPAYYHDTPNTKNPVITVSASGANAGFTNMYLKDVWASDCSYIDSTMCDYLFFVYALMIHNQPKIYHFQKGAAQPHVYPKDIVRLEVVIPTKDLLTKFNKISMDIFDSIRLLTKQNQNLKEARDILLPRLMTGMIDVEQMNLENFQPTTA